MNNSKYLIYKNAKNGKTFSIFKVLGKNGDIYTIMGKSINSKTPLSIYEINLKNFPKNSWISLDEFVKNCTVINRYFHRTKPIEKISASGNSYSDICYTFDNKSTSIVAVYENLWLCQDGEKTLYFLGQEYIDSDLEFDDINENKVWDKQSIKTALAETVDSKLKHLYNDFEM